MTVPGVRVTPVRRTVTVAVALVTGQALLCGIIGFVTFGGQSHSAAPVQAAEPPLAGPPVATPPAGPTSSAAPTEKRVTRPPDTTRSPARPVPAPVRSSSTRPIAPATTTATPVAPSAPPEPISLPSVPAFLPTTPPAESDDDNGQPPAVEKERCDVEGATAETAEGRTVRCERGRDGDLRWRLV